MQAPPPSGYRQLPLFLGAVALVVGLWELLSAFVLPAGYALTAASAVQATQVYTQATYTAVLAVACFVLAGVLVLAARR